MRDEDTSKYFENKNPNKKRFQYAVLCPKTGVQLAHLYTTSLKSAEFICDMFFGGKVGVPFRIVSWVTCVAMRKRGEIPERVIKNRMPKWLERGQPVPDGFEMKDGKIKRTKFPF